MNRTSRRKFLMLSLGAAASVGAIGCHKSPVMSHVHRRQGFALGARVSFTVIHEDSSLADAAIDAAFRELDDIEQAMSLFRAESELSRLNREGLLKQPGVRLLTVLRQAMEVSRASGGAFDITVQTLWELRHRARQAGEPVSEEAMARARSVVDWRDVEVSEELIRLKRPGAMITLNGIAQGFAADAALAAVKGHGVRHALMNVGEFSASGRSEQGDVWRAGIRDPRRQTGVLSVAELDGRCLATSGDYASCFHDDFSEHHIFDPRTGRSPTELASVSVLAPNAMLADALSTTLMVSGAARGMEILRDFPGTDALFVTKKGLVTHTPGFSPVV